MRSARASAARVSRWLFTQRPAEQDAAATPLSSHCSRAANRTGGFASPPCDGFALVRRVQFAHGIEFDLSGGPASISDGCRSEALRERSSARQEKDEREPHAIARCTRVHAR